MAKTAEHDWEALTREYITGKDTYDQIGKRHGIAYMAVKYQGTKRHWWENRRKWRQDCLRRGLERDAKKKADAISDFQNAQIAAIEMLVLEVEAVLQELSEARDDASLTLSRRVALIFQTAQAQRAIVKTSHLLTGQATEITKSLDTYRNLLDECGIKPNTLTGAQDGDDDGSTTTEALGGEGSP